MGYIRTLLTVIFLTIYFLVGLPAGLIALILDKIAPKARDPYVYAYVRFGIRGILFFSGVQMEVIGRENLLQDRTALYIGNHRSFFDVVLSYTLIPHTVAYVSKIEIRKVPFLHMWMVLSRCLFLDRTDIKQGVQMVTDATNLVKNGINVFIYPEGTRSKTEGELLPFHGGSFKVAIRSGAPVIPVTTIGSAKVLEHFPSLTPAKVRIIIGKPIETQGMPIADRKTLPDRVRNEIAATYSKYSEGI